MLFYQAVLLPGMQVPGGAAQRRQAAGAGLLQSPQRCPFLLADPDDVGCSPPLHHVSQIASSLPCPGLGGGWWFTANSARKVGSCWPPALSSKLVNLSVLCQKFERCLPVEEDAHCIGASIL